MARDPHKAAADMYEGFHRYGPRKTGVFDSSFKIPEYVFKQGAAIDVLYRSRKVDPDTLKKPRKPVDYIHEHDKGVNTYLPDGEGERTATPAWIRELDALVLLGECLGFKFEGPDGKMMEARGKAPLPELYTTTNGHALIVVEGKRKLVALIWGGRLAVEPRGIVH